MDGGLSSSQLIGTRRRRTTPLCRYFYRAYFWATPRIRSAANSRQFPFSKKVENLEAPWRPPNHHWNLKKYWEGVSG
jgi:hypothetical protein